MSGSRRLQSIAPMNRGLKEQMVTDGEDACQMAVTIHCPDE